MSAEKLSNTRKKKVVTAVIGIFLYAGSVWLTTIFPLAAAGDVNIRPGVVVPIFFGFAFGPTVGFMTGLAGNFLGDLLSGVVAFPVAAITGNTWIDIALGTFLPWQIGNGLMGLIPGFARRILPDYRTFKNHVLALGIAIVGIVIGMGFASIATVGLGTLDANFVFTQYFVPAVWSNSYNVIFLLPILLYNFEYFDLKAITVFRSGFMRRLLVLILGSAGLPIILLGLFLIQPGAEGAASDQGVLLTKLLFTIIVTMLFVIVNASMLAQRISRLIVRLANAARLMEVDQLTPEQVGELKATRGNDEISQLSRIFGQMAQETLLRQEKMRRQIGKLNIEIDQKRTEREVAAITETDYFQQLERKVEELRLIKTTP